MKHPPLRRLVAWFALLIGSVVVATVSCSLATAVDRDLIPEGGAGGTGGTGGTAGAGGEVGGGGTGGVYAQADYGEVDADQFEMEEIQLANDGADPVTMGIDFVWRDVAARPPAFDLSVELAGAEDPLLQVFAIYEYPFVRASTRVEPIEPEVAYRIEISRTNAAMWSQVVLAEDDSILLTGPVIELGPDFDDKVQLITSGRDGRVKLGAVRVWQGGASP